MHSVNSLLLNYRAGCPFAKVHWLAWAAWANPPIRFPLHLCWARLAWVCTTSQPSNFCIIFCTCRLAAECNAGAAVIRRCAVRPEYTVLASHHKLNTHSHTWRCSRPWKKKDWPFFQKPFQSFQTNALLFNSCKVIHEIRNVISCELDLFCLKCNISIQ